jgi:hypothetical protein
LTTDELARPRAVFPYVLFRYVLFSVCCFSLWPFATNGRVIAAMV